MDSGKVNGLIISKVNETERPPHFSPDKTCPNEGYSESTEIRLLKFKKKFNLISLNLYFVEAIFSQNIRRFSWKLCSASIISSTICFYFHFLYCEMMQSFNK